MKDRLIFQKYVYEGYGALRLCRYFREQNIRRKDGGEVTVGMVNRLDEVSKRISQDILALKVGEKTILSPEAIQDCIDRWEQYSFEKKKTIAKLFIKVIVITDDEIQIIFS